MLMIEHIERYFDWQNGQNNAKSLRKERIYYLFEE
jgi:hypothetical protein